MTLTLSLGMVTVDTSDVDSLARWWAEQTGAEVRHLSEGEFLVLAGGGLPVMLAFQAVDDPTPGKNRIHLDFNAEDLDATVDALIEAGARLVGRRGDESFRWVTLADPQGNEFDVAQQE